VEEEEEDDDEEAAAAREDEEEDEFDEEDARETANAMRVPALRKALEEMGETPEGNKDALVEQLVAAQAAAAAAEAEAEGEEGGEEGGGPDAEEEEEANDEDGEVSNMTDRELLVAVYKRQKAGNHELEVRVPEAVCDHRGLNVRAMRGVTLLG